MAKTNYLAKSEDRGNYIINGNFDFWQRTTSSIGITNQSVTAADRFVVNATPGSMVANSYRQTDSPSIDESGFGGTYCNTFTVTTPSGAIGASEWGGLQYRMEGKELARIISKTVTLSFWVKSTVTGTYSVAFAGGLDSNVGIIKEYSVDAADVWEKKSITIDLKEGYDFSNGAWRSDVNVGMYITWALGGGTSRLYSTTDTWTDFGSFPAGSSNNVNFVNTNGATFKMTQVSLTIGDGPKTFQRAGEDIDGELDLCHRYYYKSGTAFSGAIHTTSRNATSFGVANTSLVGTSYPHSMRTTPVVTIIDQDGVSGRVYTINSGARVPSNQSAAATQVTNRGFLFIVASSQVFNTGYGYYYHYTADAEL